MNATEPIGQGSAVITREAVQAARQVASTTGQRILTVLEESAGLDPESFLAALGHATGHHVLPRRDLALFTPDSTVVPIAESVRRDCMALRDEGGSLCLAIADPFDNHVKPWAESRIPEPFEWRLIHPAELAALLARLEAGARALDSLGLADSAPQATALVSEAISFRTLDDDPSPVVKFVNATLYDALKAGASDIHFERTIHGLVCKYRLDGVLAPMARQDHPDLAEQIVSRLKVMAELDIAESRIPQDGRFKAHIEQRDIDFRVSVMPGIYGEDVVIRVLDKEHLFDRGTALRLDRLGFDDQTLEHLRRLARQPYGMLLMTGPTGSGKTTTVYAAMSEIHDGRDKIITIEDPVEYQLPGVLQIQVNEKKGLTFARGLRSILRHDPDKLLVGEIRDPETAEIAVQAALTGHLVFTTVHANNVLDVVGRFTHMGLDPYSFVSALNGIVAQRLLRLNCPQCSEIYVPAASLLQASGLGSTELESFVFRRGAGCGHCRGTGYKGRRAIGEVLLLTHAIREMIVARAPVRALLDAARDSGTRFLREAALDCVRRGETTLEEINRVTLVE